MFTLTPPPDATGFSSGRLRMLLMTLLADDLPEEKCESDKEGRDMSMWACEDIWPKEPTAPEALGVERMSLGAVESLLSGNEAIEVRLLSADDWGRTMSVGSEGVANCLSSR
jgi:hypothetical protein